MSMNKKVLAVAIVGSLFATAANAQVVIGTGGVPVAVASELVATSGAPVTLTNAANALDIRAPLNYAMSNGEVRYARIECSPNVRFAANSTVTYTDNAAGTVALGAINGLGTNAIYFSVTATAAGVGDNAGDRFNILGDRVITDNNGGFCTYALYDQPSQAAGSVSNTTGRIATSSGNYLITQSGYTFTTTPNTTGQAVANVEATPVVFSSFLTANNPTTVATRARLSAVVFAARASTQITTTGADVTLADMFGANTAIVVNGDFSYARNNNGTYTGAALTRVYLSNSADCSTKDTNATAVSADQASFTIGSTAVNGWLCVEPNASFSIAEGSYTASLVPQSNVGYAVQATTGQAAGSITRNGTELQAPMINQPSGYVSRIALTNTGSQDRSYNIRVLNYAGSTATVVGAAQTGSVPANGGTVVELGNLISGYGVGQATRAVIVVTVAGPNNQIQGQYQIANPSTGAISSYVMARPGTN